MPSRRKRTTSTHKATAQAESAATTTEDVPVETPRQVTQVVEVVEETFDVPPSEASVEPTQEAPPREETMPEPATQPEPQKEVMETPIEQPEKRKVMVEELYTQRREPEMMPEISMHRDSSTKPLIVWAVVTIVVAILTGTVLFAVSKKSVHFPSFLVKPTPTPTPLPTPTPTPTPAPVDKKTLKVQVLNGGGVTGAASKMKKALEDKGYTVSGTGNTDEYTYETTEIHTKAASSGAIDMISTDLKDSYTLGTSSADLADSSSYDVQVIVGKK